MVGTIKQQLYISGLPAGMQLRVTALNLLPPDPAKEWRATLYTSGGTARVAPFIVDPKVNGGHIGEVKMYGAHAFPTNSDGARLEILWELVGNPVRSADGQVELILAPDTIEHPADRVPGGPVPEPTEDVPHPAEEYANPLTTVDPDDPNVLKTKLEGLTKDAYASSARATADVPVRKGRFIVETSRWGLIQRPDYVYVLYQVGDATPLRVSSTVAATIISMPKDALFVIGINATTQQIGINGVQQVDVANTLASYLIKGIFFAHEKAFGWVFGKFW